MGTTRFGRLACVALAASAPALLADDWPQWGRSPEHTGATPVVAQPLERILADVVYDPFVEKEKEESGDDLLVHYPVALLDGNAVYLGYKTGVFVACDPPGSGSPAPCGAEAWGAQTWGVKKLEWRNGVLTEAWSVLTDWKPVPNGSRLGWEPVFHPVLTSDSVWIPGGYGSVLQVAKDTGRVVARVAPFQTGALNVFVAGGLAADAAGNVYYNALQLAPQKPWDTDALGAWLVKVSPGGAATRRPVLATSCSGRRAPGIPARPRSRANPFPGRRPPAARPPQSPCGSQRPAVNAIPAIGPDGTVYTVSRAHRNDRYGYLVAVGPDLTPRWSTSLRGLLNDGCDVLSAAERDARRVPRGFDARGRSRRRASARRPASSTSPRRRRSSFPTAASCTARTRATTTPAATSSASPPTGGPSRATTSGGTSPRRSFPTAARIRSSSRTTTTTSGHTASTPASAPSRPPLRRHTARRAAASRVARRQHHGRELPPRRRRPRDLRDGTSGRLRVVRQPAGGGRERRRLPERRGRLRLRHRPRRRGPGADLPGSGPRSRVHALVDRRRRPGVRSEQRPSLRGRPKGELMRTRRHFIKTVLLGATTAGFPAGRDDGSAEAAPPPIPKDLRGDHFETCHAVRDGVVSADGAR